MNDQISVDPAIMVGKPCIKGTRITVEFIINLLAHDRSIEEILSAYPHLNRQGILACLKYAHQLLEDQFEKSKLKTEN